MYTKKGRLIGIDYGTKRIGIAVTDPLQLIATPLTTVATENIIEFLKNYEQKEEIAAFIVGLPKYLNGKSSPMTIIVTHFIAQLKDLFCNKTILSYDEKFTSKMAFNSMIEGGSTKKKRRNKENIDKISAAILLQSFLASKSTNH